LRARPRARSVSTVPTLGVIALLILTGCAASSGSSTSLGLADEAASGVALPATPSTEAAEPTHDGILGDEAVDAAEGTGDASVDVAGLSSEPSPADAPQIEASADAEPPIEASSFFDSCRWINRYSQYSADEYPRLLCRYPETAQGSRRLPLIRDCLIGPDQYCAGRDLSAARGISGNLVRTDFSGVNFSFAHISDSVFHLSNLANTSFRNAVISQTDFRLTDLSSADFTGARLQDVRWPDGSTLTTRCGPGSIGRCTPDAAPTRPAPAPPITVEVVTDGSTTDLTTTARFWFGRLAGDRYEPACDERITIAPGERSTVCSFSLPSEPKAVYRASTESATLQLGSGPGRVFDGGHTSWQADVSRDGAPGQMDRTEQGGTAVGSLWEKTGDRSYRLTLRGTTAARLGLDTTQTPVFTMSVVLNTASLPSPPYFATFSHWSAQKMRSSDTCEDWVMNSRLDPQQAVLCDLVLEPGRFNPPQDSRRFAVSVTTWDPDSSRRQTFGADITVHYQAAMGGTNAERVFVTIDGIPAGSQPLTVDRRVRWTSPTTFDVILRAGR